jgi:hypothetical protein
MRATILAARVLAAVLLLNDLPPGAILFGWYIPGDLVLLSHVLRLATGSWAMAYAVLSAVSVGLEMWSVWTPRGSRTR